MSKWIVSGGARLSGEIPAHGAKNAALPILAATILLSEPVELTNCPPLSDIEDMCEILRALGCHVTRSGNTLTVDATTASHGTLPDALSHRVRSSVFLLGSLLSRFGTACAPYPGGCEIGNRPIDLHLYALGRLGVTFTEGDGRICAKVAKLTGAAIDLDYPSVGATENAMLAAVRAEG
ncbi:MAG: UDP-N-acetylglucosamine 1-carboxyvinyltransferase, partial [Clostridia bacterium]|nr:UDP-N-acetylglucosamine 1-carboxyvinyltransferase [Clostridia bacterium]